jgi:Phage integrase, N-terminal SAM-like domain
MSSWTRRPGAAICLLTSGRSPHPGAGVGSPATLQAAESHLRLHIRPYFGGRQLGAISVHVVQRWQQQLAGKASHNLTMACRSILNRILQAAEDERLIPYNPVRKIEPPKASD